MNKLKVAVFMGGKSIEREVSFNSGRTICDHLDSTRYDIIPIFQNKNGNLYILPWRFLHRGKISDFEHKLDTQAEHISWDGLKSIVDFVYIAAHGQYAEDGRLQGFLEVLKIPYLGSKVYASAVGMNKIKQAQILKSSGICMPDSISLSIQEIAQLAKELIFEKLKATRLELPLVIKPAKEGSSFGVKVITNKEELIPAIINAATINNKVQEVIIEQFIEGMEFTCIIITDFKTGYKIPLPITEIVIEKDKAIFDYEQKYMPGRATKFTPARCSNENTKLIQETCMKVMDALDIKNLARIDGFLTKDNKVIITDPNTLAGMAPSSFVFRQAAEIDMSHTKFINHLIETELWLYNMNDKFNLSNSDQQTSNEKKLRVGVLLGGRSNEKEISLESGRNIFYKLSPIKYEPSALFLDSELNIYKIDQKALVKNSTKEIEMGLKSEDYVPWEKLSELFDFIFIGLHGGEGENGCIQGTLEMLGMPYNGSSVLTSSLCMDKHKTNQFLKSQGFSVPESAFISKDEWSYDQNSCLEKIKAIGSYPFIIKPHDDGCSVFVQKAGSDKELIDSINEIFKNGKDFALIEECIQAMELTVGVIGNDTVQALPPSQAIPTKDILSIEEKFLPGAGENQTPAPLPNETLEFVKNIIANAYKALNCRGYSRIDCFYQTKDQSITGQERVIILEVNTLPAMTPATCIFHQAAEIGIKPMEFVDLIVQLGLEEHKQIDPIYNKIKEKALNS